MLTSKDFERLGFWEDVTPEENITVYGMDLDENYLLITDELGRTPTDEKKFLVVAAYDERDSFLWGVELKSFAVLEKICAQHEPGSTELWSALENYKPQKK